MFNPQAGNCVNNIGTYTKPILEIVGCGGAKYKIIRRFDNTADRTRCNAVTGTTYVTWFQAGNGHGEFTLCLRPA